MTFGVDVSNHQTSFDFRGWDFAFLKATEGSGFKDRMFAVHLANARAAGCVVAAYHYQRNESAEAQVDNIVSMVPVNVPVIIDVEDGSGPISITRELVRLLRARGYSVPLTYLPRWYWDKIGRPDLSGLPDLWASWYPDYKARPPAEGVSMVPPSAWSSYGGLPVVLMQYTSTPFDQNFFRGTKNELAALLGSSQEDDVTADELLDTQIAIRNPDGSISKTESLRTLFEWLGNEFNSTRAVAAEPIDYDKLADEIAERVSAVDGVTAAEAKSIAIGAINNSRVRFQDSTAGGGQ